MQKYFFSYLLILFLSFSFLKADDENSLGKYYEMFVESEIFKSQNNYNDSNNILFEILDKGVINQQIYESIIDNYLMLEDIDNAIHYSIIAIDYFEDSLPFLTVLIDSYIKKIDIEGMKRILDTHNQLFLNEPLIYKKAEILFMLSDWKALIAIYEDIAIRFYSEVSELDELINRIIEIGNVTNNLQLSVISLINISKAYPTHLTIKDEIINISVNTGNYMMAIEYLSSFSDKHSTYDDKIILSRLYMMTSDYTSAYQISKNLYKANTIDFELLEIIFISLLNTGDEESFPELHSIAEKITTQFPESSMGYEAFATLYVMKEEYKKALEILTKGEKISNDTEGITFQLGLVYDYMGNKEKSLISFEQAYKMNPNNYSFVSSLAMAYDSDKQYEMCDTIYEEYISYNPSDEALNDYAYLLSDREGVKVEKLLEALKMSFEVVKDNMDNEAYLDTIGWIYYKLKNFKKARYYLEKCVEINDNNIIILEHLGDTYSKLNLPIEAREIYNKALDLDKDKLSLKEKLERTIQ